MRNKIGVFDSGLGGLEVLREIVKELPEYDYLYLGDNARAPYGSRSPEIIYRFTQQAVDFLFKKDCLLVILACNTVSCQALRLIQQEYLPQYYPRRKVLGVIIPAVEEGVAKTKNKLIGVMATEGTVLSDAFEREFKKLDPQIKVFQQACPLLVPIVEAGKQDLKTTDLVVFNYLKPLISKKIDTLILGCTHYGLLAEKIRKITGQSINIITEGQVVAGKLKAYLERHPEIENKLKKSSTIKFFTTDSTEKFKSLGSRIFGSLVQPEKVRLD